MTVATCFQAVNFKLEIFPKIETHPLRSRVSVSGQYRRGRGISIVSSTDTSNILNYHGPIMMRYDPGGILVFCSTQAQ